MNKSIMKFGMPRKIHIHSQNLNGAVIEVWEWMGKVIWSHTLLGSLIYARIKS